MFWHWVLHGCSHLFLHLLHDVLHGGGFSNSALDNSSNQHLKELVQRFAFCKLCPKRRWGGNGKRCAFWKSFQSFRSALDRVRPIQRRYKWCSRLQGTNLVHLTVYLQKIQIRELKSPWRPSASRKSMLHGDHCSHFAVTPDKIVDLWLLVCYQRALICSKFGHIPSFPSCILSFSWIVAHALAAALFPLISVSSVRNGVLCILLVLWNVLSGSGIDDISAWLKHVERCSKDLEK